MILLSVSPSHASDLYLHCKDLLQKLKEIGSFEKVTFGVNHLYSKTALEALKDQWLDYFEERTLIESGGGYQSPQWQEKRLEIARTEAVLVPLYVSTLFPEESLDFTRRLLGRILRRSEMKNQAILERVFPDEADSISSDGIIHEMTLPENQDVFYIEGSFREFYVAHPELAHNVSHL